MKDRIVSFLALPLTESLKSLRHLPGSLGVALVSHVHPLLMLLLLPCLLVLRLLLFLRSLRLRLRILLRFFLDPVLLHDLFESSFDSLHDAVDRRTGFVKQSPP